MKALFGSATLILLVSAAFAVTMDPLWALLTAAAALSSGIGYFMCRNQARADQQER